MIQAIHKGIEIEMELHQLAHGNWRCDYTLIKHLGRTQTIHHGMSFSMDLAIEYALREASRRDRPRLIRGHYNIRHQACSGTRANCADQA